MNRFNREYPSPGQPDAPNREHGEDRDNQTNLDEPKVEEAPSSYRDRVVAGRDRSTRLGVGFGRYVDTGGRQRGRRLRRQRSESPALQRKEPDLLSQLQRQLEQLTLEEQGIMSQRGVLGSVGSFFRKSLRMKESASDQRLKEIQNEKVQLMKLQEHASLIENRPPQHPEHPIEEFTPPRDMAVIEHELQETEAMIIHLEDQRQKQEINVALLEMLENRENALYDEREARILLNRLEEQNKQNNSKLVPH